MQIEITGDLVELAKTNEIDVIIHGCNCFNNMGAGIAKQIAKEFPLASKIDSLTTHGDKNKLGSITTSYIDEYDLTVVNAYTQYAYGGGKINADYDAIKKCFDTIAEVLGVTGETIAYPKIGAGLAGGDWKIINDIINESLKNVETHYLVNYHLD